MIGNKKFISVLFVSFLFISAFAQQKRVTGKIINQTNGQPVEAATVTGKISKAATVTTAEGSFSLLVPSNETGLVISSVGF